MRYPISMIGLCATRIIRSQSAVVFVTACLLGWNAAAFAAKPQPTNSAIAATRRLTESQYRHSIADIFGADIVVNGRFEPERRESGLLAIGAGMLSISASGFEQYYSMARGIADQVVDDKHRAQFIPCDANAPLNESCAQTFIRKYGRLLFRRPLAADEVALRMQLVAAGAAQSGKGATGYRLALVSLLTAPQFLFRIETMEAEPGTKGRRLDGYTKAARLSFMLWDTTPDEALLQAAESGALHTSTGMAEQVDRLLSAPRTEQGVRAFFADMLEFDVMDSVTKDASLYPKFSQDVADSAKEQTLRTVVDHLLVKSASYTELFTTRATFLNRTLASIYRVPFGSRQPWAPYTFPSTAEAAGVLTQVSFLSMFSHPGRSSPTKRGAAIREVFLCEPTPLPPANVDFSIVNDVNNPSLKTVRARLLAHSEDESCAGCHTKSDPLGLSLERFDSLGQYRRTENGDLIDVSAQLDGKEFDGAEGLGALLRDDPRTSACLVRNVYAYGVGRAPTRSDQVYLQATDAAFVKDQHRLRSLLRAVVLSPEFVAVPGNADVAPKATKIAAATAE